MSWRLPKAYQSAGFDRLTGVELNDFDVDRLLPTFFDLVVSGGRPRQRSKADPTMIGKYVTQLSRHDQLEGFDSDAGRRVLGLWVHSTVAKIGWKGRGHRDQQLDYIQPMHLLAYRAGLPASAARHRRVHVFLYQLLLEEVKRRGVSAPAKKFLTAAFESSLGAGIKFDPAAPWDGHHDGITAVDISVLLSLRYLEGFDLPPLGTGDTIGQRDGGFPLPMAASTVASDLLLYLFGYSSRLPPLALTRNLAALLNFGLFDYTVRLYRATNQMIRDLALPADMTTVGEASAASLYVDFTAERGSRSDELARACVDRDLEELRRFIESLLRLRTIEQLSKYQMEIQKRLTGLNTSEYLLELARLSEEPTLFARAELELRALEAVAAETGEDDAQQLQALLDGMLGSPVDKLVGLQVANQKRGIENAVKWFWSTGGLRKSTALLQGNTRGPRNWRYTMTDDLTSALIQVALIGDDGGSPDQATVRPRLALRELLEVLEGRWGVLINRPPPLLDNATNREAAAANLEAFKRRLRQMGYFETLSDDFAAQYVTDPVIGTRQ